MPHPSDFEKHLPATTDAERKRFWASLATSESLTAEIRAKASNHGNASWLRSLMEMGGLCFPRMGDHSNSRINGAPGDDPSNRPYVDGNFAHIDAVARMTQMSWTEEVPNGGGDGASVMVLSLETVSQEWRDFHADFCKMLVADDLAWRKEALALGNSPDKIVQSDHAKAASNTLGVALATACMLNNADSVRTIAQHDSSTMDVLINVDVLGRHNRIGLPDDNKPPRITPYCCAMQHSAIEAMDALIESGLSNALVLGINLTNRWPLGAKKMFDVLSLGNAISPLCEPAVYEKALQQRIERANDKALEKFNENALRVLDEPQSIGTIILNYLPSLIKVGAFDRDPNAAADKACRNGIPSVLHHVLPHVEWRTHAVDLASDRSPILDAARSAVGSDRTESFDAAMEAFFRGAAEAGYARSALHQVVKWEYDDSGERDNIPQPICNLVKTDSRRTINAMLQHGLEPLKSISPGVPTPMEIATREDNGMDHLMRTALARNAAQAAMAEMDAEMAPAPKRAGL